ncbi:TetR/AcrR family transcriptional regulator [Amycolatopsis circi]|uniref:TetR/AcrR family transcriptional regulator n=1 Tax=Amycolatopsis circi TaxID=871959 RepID=UPI000E26E413|nr:TetR/AcrR family transcriptional regulator [Amycolatopsis circi]
MAATATTKRARRTSESLAKILDAAVECLVESGYQGATTLEVQARAGVSRGRLLHHFPSRDALLVAAAQHLAAARVAEMAMQSTAEITAGPSTRKRIDQAVELMWTTYQQPYFWAAMELWIAARHNPGIQAALEPAERSLYTAIRSVVDQMFGAAYVKKAQYSQVRELLLTSMRGVALTYSFDPRDPAGDHHLGQWKAMAKAMLAE